MILLKLAMMIVKIPVNVHLGSVKAQTTQNVQNVHLDSNRMAPPKYVKNVAVD